jgi:hypothetical protein
MRWNSIVEVVTFTVIFIRKYDLLHRQFKRYVEERGEFGGVRYYT